ncbi:hypothetical protein [Streptacidiphilus pinicola]|uniref:hypothetical protein n=1 Tax=Streptacidiphilus pinicola TaxID=2219663 RepID=UPI001057813D|nr:hypothetical protein [Streptacidiphilus pinicola]
MTTVDTLSGIRALVNAAYSAESAGARGLWVGQLRRWRVTVEVGDLVLMTRVDRRVAIGRISGPYEYRSAADAELRHARRVEWLAERVPRRLLRPIVGSSFGSPQTVYEVRAADAGSLLEAALASGDLQAAADEDSLLGTTLARPAAGTMAYPETPVDLVPWSPPLPASVQLAAVRERLTGGPLGWILEQVDTELDADSGRPWPTDAAADAGRWASPAEAEQEREAAFQLRRHLEALRRVLIDVPSMERETLRLLGRAADRPRVRVEFTAAPGRPARTVIDPGGTRRELVPLDRLFQRALSEADNSA